MAAMAGILIVEDEPLIRLAISVSLEGAGFDVVGTADTGPAALEAAFRHRPSIVLIDITLRGPLDGIETAQLLEQRFGVSILFITGQVDQASKARAFAATSPRGYLCKPFTVEQLTDAVRDALDPEASA
jgi:CheY-like chemotaxis protein